MGVSKCIRNSARLQVVCGAEVGNMKVGVGVIPS